MPRRDFAVLILAGEESDDFRQRSVPRIEREAWFDVRPGSLRTAPGHLLIGRWWCDRGEEGTLSDSHRLIEWPRLASRPGQERATEEHYQGEPQGHEELWPDELLDSGGESGNFVLHHLGVEVQEQLADADDEERDDCRDQNEYECGSQERPRKPTHPAVPPRCVSRQFTGRVGSSPTLSIIGAAR